MGSKRTRPVFAPVFQRQSSTGTLALVMYNSKAIDEAVRPSNPHGRRVIVEVPKEMRLESGLANRDGNARLDDQAESLLAKLAAANVAFVYPGRYTASGQRVHVFQVAVAADFDAVVQAWAAQQAWTTRCEPTPGWSFVDDMIKPTPDEIDEVQNLNLISALASAGVDRSKPHQIDHFFNGSPDSLGRLRPALSQKGLILSERVGDGLMASEARMLDVRQVSARTKQLRQLAGEYGAEYDGWGAAVKRKRWWWPF